MNLKGIKSTQNQTATILRKARKPKPAEVAIPEPPKIVAKPAKTKKTNKKSR